MRILIVDDHALVREGLRRSMSDNYSSAAIFEANNGESLKALLATIEPTTLLLLDLMMPQTNPFNLITLISKKWPETRIVVLSATDRYEDVNKVIDLGAHGFISKTVETEKLILAIEQVLKGKIVVPEVSDIKSILPLNKMQVRSNPLKKAFRLPVSMTGRQLEVLKLLLKGKSNRNIAEQLQLSESTIKIHLTNIYKLMNVSNRTEAVIKANHYKLSES